MGRTAEATYENGVLRLAAPLPELSDGQRVRVTIYLVNELESPNTAASAITARMEEQGLIEHPAPPAAPPPQDWQPLVLEGELLSETVIKMRREE